MTARRTGRPPRAGLAAEVAYKLRLTRGEREALDAAAAEVELSPADFLRAAIRRDLPGEAGEFRTTKAEEPSPAAALDLEEHAALRRLSPPPEEPPGPALPEHDRAGSGPARVTLRLPEAEAAMLRRMARLAKVRTPAAYLRAMVARLAAAEGEPEDLAELPAGADVEAVRRRVAGLRRVVEWTRQRGDPRALWRVMAAAWKLRDRLDLAERGIIETSATPGDLAELRAAVEDVAEAAMTAGRIVEGSAARLPAAVRQWLAAGSDMEE